MPNKFQQGIVPPIVLILAAVILLAVALILKNLPVNQAQPTPDKGYQANQISPTPASTSSPESPTPTEKITLTPTSTPSLTPTPSLSIRLPVGNTWTVGETKKISWEAVNLPYVRIYIEDATITGSGSTNYIYGDAMPANQGYFDWTIASNQLPGGTSLPRNYRIRVDGLYGTNIGAKVAVTSYSTNQIKIVNSEVKTYTWLGNHLNATTICDLNSQNLFNVKVSGFVSLKNQSNGAWLVLTGEGKTLILSYQVGGGSPVRISAQSGNGTFIGIRDGLTRLRISDNLNTYKYEMKVYEAPYTSGIPVLTDLVGDVSFSADCK